ncbi:unnamed protein product, partial [Discosporangium mesarthrocarpum]
MEEPLLSPEDGNTTFQYSFPPSPSPKKAVDRGELQPSNARSGPVSTPVAAVSRIGHVPSLEEISRQKALDEVITLPRCSRDISPGRLEKKEGPFAALLENITLSQILSSQESEWDKQHGTAPKGAFVTVWPQNKIRVGQSPGGGVVRSEDMGRQVGEGAGIWSKSNVQVANTLALCSQQLLTGPEAVNPLSDAGIGNSVHGAARRRAESTELAALGRDVRVHSPVPVSGAVEP